MVIDQTPPTAYANAALRQVGGDINVSSSLDGTGSAIASATLYYRYNDGAWNPGGDMTAGSINFTPTNGAGNYGFQVAATDAAGNMTPLPPSAAQATTAYNPTDNGAMTMTLTNASTQVFPMTDSSYVTIDATGVTAPASFDITVQRHAPLGAAPAGYNGARLINEYLSITSNPAISGGTVNVVWNYDPASDNALSGTLNTLFQFEGGTLQNAFSTPQITVHTGNATIEWNTATFSEWYAGDAAADVTDWTLLND
jgi:hypothetical protein